MDLGRAYVQPDQLPDIWAPVIAYTMWTCWRTIDPKGLHFLEHLEPAKREELESRGWVFWGPGTAREAQKCERYLRNAAGLEESSRTSVYVIGSPESHLIKIGYSDDPVRRLREIQNMSPASLQILWITPGNMELEQRLHRVFAERRRHGEWFDFSDVADPVQTVAESVFQP
jgi:hypothetical protein